MATRASSEFWHNPDSMTGGREAVLWLDDPRCQDANLVGNKAAGLARLTARYNIPSGFAIPNVSIRHSGLPSASLQIAIDSAYRELGDKIGTKNPNVAVRSSALDEDGKQASFAGMHDTFLNVKGLDAILDAIQKCWASAVSERAVVYRQGRGLPVDDIQIAALVQQMVPADISGIAFSLNPVTGSQNEIIMNSSWGLGESIVAGSVTPDTVTVRKSDLAITAQDIGRKMRMTIAVSGSTKEVAVPRFLQEQPCLEESKIQAIARMVRGLEDELNMAVDVEYAIANGELFLLQCRPVTGHIR